jgi:hypothetical protein
MILREFLDPIVAVIIPTYKQNSFLFESVKSVIEDKSTHVVVVIDGCPHSETFEICDLMLELYPKNLTILFQQNSGLSHSRNLGINFVISNLKTIKYISFLDSDDKMSPNSITEMLQTLKSAHDVKVFTHPMLKAFGVESYEWSPPEIGHLPYNYLWWNNLPYSIMLPIEYFNTNNYYRDSPSGKIWPEDWEFGLRLSFEDWRPVPTKKALLLYRTRGDSMATDVQKRINDVRIEFFRYNSNIYDLKRIEKLRRIQKIMILDSTRSENTANIMLKNSQSINSENDLKIASIPRWIIMWLELSELIENVNVDAGNDTISYSIKNSESKMLEINPKFEIFIQNMHTNHQVDSVENSYENIKIPISWNESEVEFPKFPIELEYLIKQGERNLIVLTQNLEKVIQNDVHPKLVINFGEYVSGLHTDFPIITISKSMHNLNNFLSVTCMIFEEVWLDWQIMGVVNLRNFKSLSTSPLSIMFFDQIEKSDVSIFYNQIRGALNLFDNIILFKNDLFSIPKLLGIDSSRVKVKNK